MSTWDMGCMFGVILVLSVSNLHFCACQSFSIQPKDALGLKKQDITLSCQATGLVNPSYYWLKDGVNTTRGSSSVTNLQAFFKITTLTFQDAGRYACCAFKNSISITSSYAQLTIQGSPDIIQPPSPVTSHEGYTASFTCSAVANPTPSISWRHDSKQISNGGQIAIFGNGSLVIRSLTKANAGTYSCRVKNYFGENGAFADLTVLDPPSPPIFTTTPRNFSATEGTDAVFYCQASGSPFPTIRWRRISGGVIPSDRRTQPRPGALGISNLSPLDEGMYACIANNSQGEKSAHVYLNVKGYPRFQVSPTSRVVKEKDSVSFSCTADSDPKPRMSWQLPNGLIVSNASPSSPNFKVFVNNTLKLLMVQEQDQGLYTCIAENPVGTKKVTATLSVLISPKFSSKLPNVTKISNQALSITCPARANPSPSFHWLFKGAIIGTSQQLRLVSVDVSSEGIYTCVVNNTLGSSSESFYLRVIVVPVITLRPTNKTIGIGGTATFSCQSSGDPAPDITWYQFGIPVQIGGRYSILANNSLVITNVIFSDHGLLTCKASNAAGSAEEKALLFVTDSPRFTLIPNNLTVDVGEKAQLNCRSTGKQAPIITWLKVDQSGIVQKVPKAKVLASGDLLFSAIQRGDRAQYMCRACNAAGCVTTSKVILNVLYYPSFLVPPNDVGVLQGEDAVLRCEPDASPEAKITWRKPDGNIFGGNDYEQIVTNVQPSDTGSYHCEAVNYLGKAGPVKIALTIQTKSEITDFSRTTSASTETVTCLVRGKPLPRVAWFVGKDLLPKNAKYPNYIITADKKLQIPVGSRDKVNFLCNATNAQNSDAYLVKVPLAPTSVSTANIQEESIKVTWTRTSPSLYLVTHYRLEKLSDLKSWELVDDDVKDTFYSVSNLKVFTVYQFRVKAVNGLGSSNFSVTSGNVSTLSSSPSPPMDVKYHVMSPSQINITWLLPMQVNGPLNNIMYRVIYYPKLPNITNDFNVSRDNSKSEQELLLVDLTADIQYSVSLYAWRRRVDDGAFLRSKFISFSAKTLQIVPMTPPLSLTAVSNGPFSIFVKWMKPPYSIKGYNILFMEDEKEANFTTVILSNGGATSYVIMGLKQNTPYKVKVQMYSNQNDQGPFSSLIEVTTATDYFGSSAGRTDDERSISWKVAVGGIVCGIALLILVSVIVWCWLKRTRLTNHTFQISKRRKRTPSSTLTEGSFEGQYNIGAFNHELDDDLDLEMFANAGNVVPISTSFSNERAIACLNPASTNKGDDSAYAQKDNVYENDFTTPQPSSQNLSRPIQNNNLDFGVAKQPLYAQIDPSKKKKPKQANNETAIIADPLGQVPTVDKLDASRKAKYNHSSNDSPPLQSQFNQVPSYEEVDIPQKIESKQAKDEPLIDHRKHPSSSANDSKSTLMGPSQSIDQILDQKESTPLSEDFPEFPDNDSDISDVPFPIEDLPPMERTWTNVSEFNFPPPPTDSPPLSPASPIENNKSPDMTPIADQQDLSVKGAPTEPSANSSNNGIKNKRMVASWGDTDDEPIGNLWEAVDKELDRRLGTN